MTYTTSVDCWSYSHKAVQIIAKKIFLYFF